MTTATQRRRDHASIAAYASVVLVLLGAVVSGCIMLGRQAQRIDGLEARISANSRRAQTLDDQLQALDTEVARIRAHQQLLHHLGDQ